MINNLLEIVFIEIHHNQDFDIVTFKKSLYYFFILCTNYLGKPQKITFFLWGPAPKAYPPPPPPSSLVASSI